MYRHVEFNHKALIHTPVAMNDSLDFILLIASNGEFFFNNLSLRGYVIFQRNQLTLDVTGANAAPEYDIQEETFRFPHMG